MSASSLVCAFPGQGIQKPGMADGIRETGVWKFFERANDILDYDLGKLCLEGPAETLSRTVYAQPAIFVTSYAIWELYKSDYEPDKILTFPPRINEQSYYSTVEPPRFIFLVKYALWRGSSNG